MRACVHACVYSYSNNSLYPLCTGELASFLLALPISLTLIIIGWEDGGDRVSTKCRACHIVGTHNICHVAIYLATEAARPLNRPADGLPGPCTAATLKLVQGDHLRHLTSPQLVLPSHGRSPTAGPFNGVATLVAKYIRDIVHALTMHVTLGNTLHRLE